MVRESKHKFDSVKLIVFAEEFAFTKLPPKTIVKGAFVAIKFGELSDKLMICSLQNALATNHKIEHSRANC